MQQAVRFDPEMLSRYDVNGPRYTSYPTAMQFTNAFREADYRAAVRAAAPAAGGIAGPLSIYAHIPFCTSPCFYCACTRIITRDPLKAALYLEHLYREIDMHAAVFGRDRSVEQLHFGGGTPTFLSMEQMTELMRRLRANFNLREDETREFSIEIDPRTVDAERIEHLASLGFNRVSLGVQDFDRRVQEAVNRVQGVDDTLAVIAAARKAGVRSINLDLIYGLPFQSPDGFARTLDIVIGARPERLAVYSYAHMPAVFKAQRQIDSATLPDRETKLALLELAIHKLTAAGYSYIGMDHFALPDDELVTAQRNGGLQRNFQGYSTRAECDMLALGISAIGRIGNAYSQNEKDIRKYYAMLNAGELPVVRGIVLSEDDVLRRDIIQRIMCQGELRFADVESRLNCTFSQYFHAEQSRLETLASDGLVTLSDRGFTVTSAGRLLLRVIAMTFDAYLAPPRQERPRFSRVI